MICLCGIIIQKKIAISIVVTHKLKSLKLFKIYRCEFIDLKVNSMKSCEFFQIRFVNKIAKSGHVTKQGKFSFCHIMGNKALMRFFKPLIDKFTENINFDLECPFKKVIISNHS